MRCQRSLPIPPLALVLAAALMLAGCGDDEEGVDAVAEGTPDLTVVATTGVAADIVERVAGDRLEVIQLVPEGANPHNYSPSAREQQELEESGLLVFFHPALEEALPLQTANKSFSIARNIGGIRRFAEGEVAGTHDDGDDHGDGTDEGHDDERGHDEDDERDHGAGTPDPHVWLDPTAIGAALPALADALAEIDPEGAQGYSERAAGYAAELQALDAELERMVDTIPEEHRKLVTSHELMGYFADRYGFEFVGAPFGTSPEAEASAAAVASLIEEVEEHQVPAVFAQQGDDPKVLRLIADEAGVEVVDDLLVESFGEQAGSYVEMMRFTTERITDALSG